MKRKLKMGMVGGGRGAFIGGVHRRAANLDGEIELVAGAFSSDPKKSKQSGKDYHLDSKRVYGSYKEMAVAEAALPEGERIDFVTIVVQNFLHFDVAKTFLEAGFNVICDKPVTYDLEEARELRKIIKTRGHFPSDDAAAKLIWLALRNITAKWSRSAHDWKQAMKQFAILYEGRFSRLSV